MRGAYFTASTEHLLWFLLCTKPTTAPAMVGFLFPGGAMTRPAIVPNLAKVLAVAVALTLTACGVLPNAASLPVDPPAVATAPTLADFWEGRAHFLVDVTDTGLPLGESDTVVLPNGVLRSYVHASHPSLGVMDQCGDPVAFPGCVVLFESRDGGQTFAPQTGAGAPVCLLPCLACPCDSRRDHVDQQQYPRVVTGASTGATAPTWWMVYEYRANTIVRRSADGATWSAAREAPLTGIWRDWLTACPPAAGVGPHPYAEPAFDCLVGSPPGLYLDETVSPAELYVFLGIGQNPGSMACYHGPANAPTALFSRCFQWPLFTGSAGYGPLDVTDAAANTYFDFRTVSSAEAVRVDDYVYLFYEGVRGPGPGDAGDTQFLLGLARAPAARVDGPWERYPHNPILLDLPGNVGVGHADLVIVNGETYLYTTLDGSKRSRLHLVRR